MSDAESCGRTEIEFYLIGILFPTSSVINQIFEHSLEQNPTSDIKMFQTGETFASFPFFSLTSNGTKSSSSLCEVLSTAPDCRLRCNAAFSSGNKNSLLSLLSFSMKCNILSCDRLVSFERFDALLWGILLALQIDILKIFLCCRMHELRKNLSICRKIFGIKVLKAN